MGPTYSMLSMGWLEVRASLLKAKRGRVVAARSLRFASLVDILLLFRSNVDVSLGWLLSLWNIRWRFTICNNDNFLSSNYSPLEAKIPYFLGEKKLCHPVSHNSQTLTEFYDLLPRCFWLLQKFGQEWLWLSGALHWPLCRYLMHWRTIIIGRVFKLYYFSIHEVEIIVIRVYIELYFVYSAIPSTDVRWTGDADITNDPKLESLTENYLKIREGRLRNIAFSANVTGGDEIKQMTNRFL